MQSLHTHAQLKNSSIQNLPEGPAIVKVVPQAGSRGCENALETPEPSAVWWLSEAAATGYVVECGSLWLVGLLAELGGVASLEELHQWGWALRFKKHSYVV